MRWVRSVCASVSHPHIFSADHVRRSKPAPALFLHAASSMGADPRECVVIKDSLAGVTAARAAGMTVLGFHGASCCPPGHGERLKQAGAEQIFIRMLDLPALIDVLD